jgi:hypothetical protein
MSGAVLVKILAGIAVVCLLLGCAIIYKIQKDED